MGGGGVGGVEHDVGCSPWGDGFGDSATWRLRIARGASVPPPVPPETGIHGSGGGWGGGGRWRLLATLGGDQAAIVAGTTALDGV